MKILDVKNKAVKFATGMVLLLIFILYYASLEHNIEDTNKVVLDSGWTVEIGDEVYEDVSMYDLKFGLLKKGECVRMSRYLPSENKVANAVIRVNIYHCAVNVYIGDECIYSYGMERLYAGRSTGKGYHLIDIPDDYQGKELVIEMVVGEDSRISHFDEIVLLEGENALKEMIVDHRFTFFADTILVALGFVGVAVALALYPINKSEKFSIVVWTATFAFAIGIWGANVFNFSILLSSNYVFNEYIEYMALYGAVFSILMIFKHFFGAYAKTVKHITDMAFIHLLFMVVVNIGMLLRFFSVASTLTVFHCLVCVEFVIVIFEMTKNGSNMKKKSEKILVRGVAVLAAAMFTAMAIYYIVRFGAPNSLKFKSNAIICLCALIFSIIMIISLGVSYAEGVSKQARSAALEQLAYYDSLTGLHNRNFMEQFIGYKNIKREYVLFAFDLNDFKARNDVYGHLAGDDMLSVFGMILKRVFLESKYKDALVARIGGDEFLAMVPAINEREVSEIITSIYDEIDRENSRSKAEMQIATAIGVAYSTEVADRSPEAVYRLADRRMYQDKEKSKNKHK